MKVEKWDSASADNYHVNEFVVLFQDDENPTQWWPKVMDEKDIGDLLARGHYGEIMPDFKVFDADEDGYLEECTLRGQPLKFDEDDYADAQTRIMRGATQVGTASARIDGRA